MIYWARGDYGYFYLTGKTYDRREELKADGCRWDAARKAWTTKKRSVVQKYADRGERYECPGCGEDVRYGSGWCYSLGCDH